MNPRFTGFVQELGSLEPSELRSPLLLSPLTVGSAAPVRPPLLLLRLPNEGCGQDDMASTSLHSLVQDCSLAFKSLDKVRIGRFHPRFLCVQFVTPTSRVGVDSCLRRVELRLQFLLPLLQPFYLLEPPGAIHPANSLLIVAQDGQEVWTAGTCRRVPGTKAEAFAVEPEALVARALAMLTDAGDATLGTLSSDPHYAGLDARVVATAACLGLDWRLGLDVAWRGIGRAQRCCCRHSLAAGL